MECTWGSEGQLGGVCSSCCEDYSLALRYDIKLAEACNKVMSHSRCDDVIESGSMICKLLLDHDMGCVQDRGVTKQQAQAQTQALGKSCIAVHRI